MSITVYTTSTCAYCPMVKKFLTHKGLDYQEVNLDANPERRQEAYELSGGALTVPVTSIELEGNSRVVVGWNPGKLTEALA